MPLHLLGHKSWNVYNADNVARVQADEAAAAAAEHAQEQRMQEADAARRLAILRGETPPPLPEPEPEIDPSNTKFERRDKTSTSGFASRKRKRNGEDDTDFEMRLVKERAEAGKKVAAELGGGRAPGDKRREVTIVGRDGHIDLVGAPPKASTGKEEKNPEYEKEAATKKRELEDQYTMRFSNAAGRDGFAAGDPWYASSSTRKAAPASAARQDGVGIEAPTKNVWGRDDPKRQEREVKRIASSDPLAMMKMGAKKVRQIEKERKKDNEERARELEDLERDERRREKRRKTDKHGSHGGRDRDREGDNHRHRTIRSERSERRHNDKQDRIRHRSKDRHSTRDSEKYHDRGRSRVMLQSSGLHGDGESRHPHRRHEGDHET